MVAQNARSEDWRLVALYPLAAVLVFMRAQQLFVGEFGEDWPYLGGGPLGALAWWSIITVNPSWWTVAGGYFFGAAVCFGVVVALRNIAGRLRKKAD